MDIKNVAISAIGVAVPFKSRRVKRVKECALAVSSRYLNTNIWLKPQNHFFLTIEWKLILNIMGIKEETCVPEK